MNIWVKFLKRLGQAKSIGYWTRVKYSKSDSDEINSPFGQLGIDGLFFFQKILSSGEALEDALQGQRFVANDLLLDVQDGDVARNDQLTSRDGPQEGRLAETVATDEAIATSVRQGQVGARYQNLKPAFGCRVSC